MAKRDGSGNTTAFPRDLPQPRRRGHTHEEPDERSREAHVGRVEAAKEGEVGVQYRVLRPVIVHVPESFVRDFASFFIIIFIRNTT